jgi:hypothetical protein
MNTQPFEVKQRLDREGILPFVGDLLKLFRQGLVNDGYAQERSGLISDA